ncbi:hypothetical protein E2C01_011599 [Portunus trituberculatus]|uniref:Uncharacterized protein n=1 Tax=Portunus trituberculatus TaxID=210409 RepID=A0A5B7DCE0_PORTR|nr:hypothetical protein [Portunus trituberculatus]
MQARVTVAGVGLPVRPAIRLASGGKGAVYSRWGEDGGSQEAVRGMEGRKGEEGKREGREREAAKVLRQTYPVLSTLPCPSRLLPHLLLGLLPTDKLTWRAPPPPVAEEGVGETRDGCFVSLRGRFIPTLLGSGRVWNARETLSHTCVWGPKIATNRTRALVLRNRASFLLRGSGGPSATRLSVTQLQRHVLTRIPQPNRPCFSWQRNDASLRHGLGGKTKMAEAADAPPVCPKGRDCKANFLCGESDGLSGLVVAIARPAPTNESNLAFPLPAPRASSVALPPPAAARGIMTVQHQCALQFSVQVNINTATYL